MTESTSRPLTVEEKQQSLYAALLRYSPEAGELRERALQRIVMAALLSSSPASPMREGAIVANIRFGSASLELRPNLVQATLHRLCADSLVVLTEVRKRRAYHLAPEAMKQMEATVTAGEELFTPVLARLLRNTAHLVGATTASRIVRGFISASFAKFGRQIARSVIGQGTREDVVPDAEAKSLFRSATSEVTLSVEAWESLESRCLAFLRSKQPDDEKLKFYLTQSYYFAQLLGLDNVPFNPLAEEAFAGSTFYLDSNILIPRLLESDLANRFDELVRQAQRLGVQLVVTRATINEIRRVAADKEPRLDFVLHQYSEQITQVTDDAFLDGYLQARQRDGMTLRTFMSRFDELSNILHDQLRVEVDERIEQEMLEGRDLRDIMEVMQEEALVVRKRRKPTDVLEHDAAHFALIAEERNESQKTWFLTRDRSLLRSGVRLANGGAPFSFSFLGFLQSLSPFLATGEGENPLLDVFSTVLAEQIFPDKPVFDLQELQLIAEIHEDILQTPRDKLIEAFDFVKTTVLDGGPYTKEKAGKFAVGLKAYLASSANEKNRSLLDEQERLRSETERKDASLVSERLQRSETEQRALQLEGEVKNLNQVVVNLTEAENNALQRAASEALRRERRERRDRFWGMVRGFGGAATLWYFRQEIAGVAAPRFPRLADPITSIGLVVSLFASLWFCLPALSFVSITGWSNEKKTAFLALVITVGVAVSRLIRDEAWSVWSSYIQIGTFAALLLVSFVSIRSSSHRG